MRLSAFRAPLAVALVALLSTSSFGHDVRPDAAAEESPFSPNVRVTDGQSPFPHQVEPTLVMDPTGRLLVGWKEAFTATGPGRRVGFARSVDGGLSWSTNILMDRENASRNQSDPWLAVDELGRAYYARLEFADDGGGDVRVSRSDDGGLVWGPIANADDRPGFADKESMTSDGAGTLYVAYDDIEGSTTDIRIARSTDAGRTWSATVPVPDRTGDLLAPVVAARPGGSVIVAWWSIADGDILADASRDHGATWGADIRINAVPGSARFDATAPFQLSLPSIATDRNGTVFVAWPDRGAGDPDILVARSADGGATWSAPVRVNDDASRRDQWMPALAADRNGDLHVAWMDNRTGNLNVFYARSTDGGRTWSPNVRVTTAQTPSTYTRPGDYLGLAVDGDGVAYVGWTDGRGIDLDIYFARYPAPVVAPPPPMVLNFVVISLIAVAAAAAVVTYVVLRHRRKRGPPPAPGEEPRP